MDIIDEIEGTTIKFKESNGKIITFDLPQVFAIDEEHLSEDFASQAAMFAYFSAKLADAERAFAIADFKLDVAYADADDEFRAQADHLDRKITEPQIKSLVMRDKKYGMAKDAQIEAKYVVDLLKAIVNAMKQRADMLISLGAQTRQEWNMTGMRINNMDAAVDNIKQKIRERASSKQV